MARATKGKTLDSPVTQMLVDVYMGEYTALRKEIPLHMRRVSYLVVYSIVGTGALVGSTALTSFGDRPDGFASMLLLVSAVLAMVAAEICLRLLHFEFQLYPSQIQFGYPDPVSVHVDTFGTATVSDEKIVRAVNKVFSFQPADIIDQLNLRRPIYSKTTNYGHFGKNDKDLTWEATNKIEALLKAI